MHYRIYLISKNMLIRCLVAQSCATLCNPWTITLQAPLSVEFSRQDILVSPITLRTPLRYYRNYFSRDSSASLLFTVYCVSPPLNTSSKNPETLLSCSQQHTQSWNRAHSRHWVCLLNKWMEPTWDQCERKLFSNKTVCPLQLKESPFNQPRVYF